MFFPQCNHNALFSHIIYQNNCPLGQTEKFCGEVTHLRSRGIILQQLLSTVGWCQIVALDGEVAVVTVDGKMGEAWGVASADARRQTALPESCRSLRQLSPSPPPILPPLPLPSVKHTRTHTYTHTYTEHQVNKRQRDT